MRGAHREDHGHALHALPRAVRRIQRRGDTRHARGGPGRATMVPSYFSYQNFFERANVGYGATISTVMTVIIVVLTILFIRVQSRQELQEAL